MLKHTTQWVTPAPLWPAAPTPGQVQPPAVLQFEGDAFMEDLFALLAADPGRLQERVMPDGPAKLFQPTHGSFYLVAASLVCRLPGLPDRAADPAADKVGFVLRRLDASGELAWVTGIDGKKVWQPAAELLAEREELFPLFPGHCRFDGRGRRVYFGLVPTSSREAFVSAQPVPADTAYDPLKEMFEDRVLAPVKGLANDPIPLEVQQEVSRFVLLDFGELCKQAQEDPIVGPPSPGTASRKLYDWLVDNSVGGRHWLDALKAARAEAARITGDDPTPPQLNLNLKGLPLEAPLKDARGLLLAASGPLAGRLPKTVPMPVPKLAAGQQYVIRCVYQRPACAGLHPDTVSEPSRPFEIAGFYDTDAPGRPIRIVLPTDTSLAAMRKYAKNVGFVTSANLRRQLSRVPGLKGLGDGKPESGGAFTLGEICSFSIPIITICAFALLIVILIALNIVFWWVPLFRLCFPIPKPE